MAQEVMLDDGTYLDNMKWITDIFENVKMTVFTRIMDRAHYGSAHDGKRLFFVILNVHPIIGKPIERQFQSMLDILRVPTRRAANDVLLDWDLISERSQKRETSRLAGNDAKWRVTHEAFFASHGIAWPLAPHH